MMKTDPPVVPVLVLRLSFQSHLHAHEHLVLHFATIIMLFLTTIALIFRVQNGGAGCNDAAGYYIPFQIRVIFQLQILHQLVFKQIVHQLQYFFLSKNYTLTEGRSTFIKLTPTHPSHPDRKTCRSCGRTCNPTIQYLCYCGLVMVGSFTHIKKLSPSPSSYHIASLLHLHFCIKVETTALSISVQ